MNEEQESPVETHAAAHSDEVDHDDDDVQALSDKMRALAIFPPTCSHVPNQEGHLIKIPNDHSKSSGKREENDHGNESKNAPASPAAAGEQQEGKYWKPAATAAKDSTISWGNNKSFVDSKLHDAMAVGIITTTANTTNTNDIQAPTVGIGIEALEDLGVISRHELRDGVGEDGTASTAATMTPPLLLQSVRVGGESLPGAHAVGGIASNRGQQDPSESEYTESERVEHAFEGEVVPDDMEDDPTCTTAAAATCQTIPEVYEGMNVSTTTTGAAAASPMSLSNKQRWKGWVAMLAFFLVACGILVAVLMATANNNKNGSVGSAPAPTPPPPSPYSSTTTIYPAFDEDLLSQRIKNQILDAHPDNAVYMANRWMLADPYLDSYTKNRLLMRFYLVAVYYQNDGQHWLRNDNWLDYEITECDWYMNVPSLADQELYRYNYTGTCDEDSNIIVIDLHANNLTGRPLDLFLWLWYMEYFDISFNNIEGQATAFPIAPSCEVFVVAHNKFSGFLFAEAPIEWNPIIRVFRIDGNSFVGSFNDHWKYWPNIEVFNTTGNSFEVELHPSVYSAAKLRYLEVADMAMYGTLPTELGLVTMLEHMDISGNVNLGGTIPSEIGLLNSSGFTLNVEGTSISGFVPQEVCEERTIEVQSNCSRVGCCL